MSAQNQENNKFINIVKPKTRIEKEEVLKNLYERLDELENLSHQLGKSYTRIKIDPNLSIEALITLIHKIEGEIISLETEIFINEHFSDSNNNDYKSVNSEKPETNNLKQTIENIYTKLNTKLEKYNVTDLIVTFNNIESEQIKKLSFYSGVSSEILNSFTDFAKKFAKFQDYEQGKDFDYDFFNQFNKKSFTEEFLKDSSNIIKEISHYKTSIEKTIQNSWQQIVETNQSSILER